MILVLAWSACVSDPTATDTFSPVEPNPAPPHPPPHTGPVPDDTADTGTTTTTETTGPASVLQFTGTPPTNLLIVSLDTTRRDYIGRFSGSGNTPNLDGVMAEGVVLENHRSCSSWTAPSMTCVVTGLSPYELDWWPWTSDGQIDGFDADMPTLAGQLQFQKGYRTTLVTANSVFDSGLNFDRGFDRVVRPSWLPADAVAADGLLEAADLAGDLAPFYLHVHFIDPHGNYCPPEEFIDQEDYVDIGEDVCASMYSLAGYDYWNRDQAWADAFLTDLLELYDAELEFWDFEFGKFWTALDTMGALDDTLVVFVTDHGEQILERGSLGHGATLGSEENRATAAFWAKNIVPQVWTGNTLHQDVAATLQDYFGLVPPTPSSGMIVGTAPIDRAIRGMLYWGPGALRLSIVKEDQQLLYDFWGEKHYYDLTYEPTGLVDLYDAADPTVQDLWVPMETFANEVYAKWPSVGAPNLLGP